MRINIKPFTKEEVNTINDFMHKEVLTDNNDEIITTFLDVKNSLEAVANEDADVIDILHLAFDNEKSIKRIKVFGNSVFLIKILMLLTAFREDMLPDGAKPGMKFLSENFFTVEFDSIDGLQNILLDDASVNYGLDLIYLNELGVNKLITDGAIKVYTHQLLGAYKPYARVFYLPVENRFFNESEIPEDVTKLAWLVKDLFLDDLFDYEEDVKNAGFTLGDKDWKSEGGKAA